MNSVHWNSDIPVFRIISVSVIIKYSHNYFSISFYILFEFNNKVMK